MIKGLILRENRGFTLIELLIVIAIIGLLAGIAVPMFLGQRTKSMLLEAQTNIQVIATANENFYAENGRYAPWKGWPSKADQTGVDTAIYTGLTTAVDGAIEFELRGVKFGKTIDLKFDYKLDTCAEGQAFLVTATGKTGTPVEGRVFTINQRNELGTTGSTCG